MQRTCKQHGNFAMTSSQVDHPERWGRTRPSLWTSPTAVQARYDGRAVAKAREARPRVHRGKP